MNKKSTFRSVANNYLTHPTNEKGITLIALVVTIIVLIILAGLSINLLFGDNGIIKKAQDSKIKLEEAAEEERKILDSYAATVDKSLPLVNDINPNIFDMPAAKELNEFLDYIPIYNLEQLQKIGSNENMTIEGTDYSMTSNAKYVLMNDLTNITMKPIKGFTGVFDGNGHSIRGLNIDTTSDPEDYTVPFDNYTRYHPAGLFEYVSGGTIKNIAIYNADIKSKEAVGAIVAQGDNVIIENCYVKDSVLYTDSSCCIGGIIAFVSDNGVTIKNCKVVNTEICNNPSATAGICSISCGPVSISDCEVIGLGASQIPYGAGVLFYAKASTEILNCKVQNIKLMQSGSAIVSMVQNFDSSRLDNVTIKDCTAKNINVVNNNYGAGILFCADKGLGKVEISGCSVENYSSKGGDFNAGIVGILKANTIIVDDCHTRNMTADGGSVAAGIICHISDAYIDSSNVTISNCSVDNFTHKNSVGNVTGGVYAIIDRKQQNSTALIKNCNVNNFVFESGTTHLGGIGGYAGKAIIENCIVTGSKFNITNSVNSLGGIVGNCEDLTIKNCKVNDFQVELSGTETKRIYIYSFGGAVGISKTRKIENCSVTNVKNIRENAYDVWLGGFIGNSCGYDDSEIINCKVKDFLYNYSDENGSGYVTLGGFGGHVIAKKVEKCNVENFIFNRDNATLVHLGGIIGTFDPTVNEGGIFDCKATNMKFNLQLDPQNNNNGYISAGITAVFKDTGKVQNCIVDNLELNGDFTAFGGICGVTDTVLIDNCTIKNSNIIAAKNNISGGIAGTGENVSNCVVQNTTIEVKGFANPNGTRFGGIIGTGKKNETAESLVNNCKVLGCTIIVNQGKHVGGISGTAVSNIANCTVENTSITADANTVGGIQGYGGALGPKDTDRDSYGSIQPAIIDSCNVTNCSIKSNTINKNYIQGLNTDDGSGNPSQDQIINCTYNGTTIDTL